MKGDNIRLSLTLPLGVAMVMWALQVVAFAQRTVEGTSVQLDLGQLVPSNAGAEKMQGLARALDELSTVTSESLELVRGARLAYEQNPSAETESGLFHANANVIRSQYDAFGGVMQAARDAGEVLETLRGDAVTASETFAEQAEVTEQDRRRAIEVVERIESHLEDLASRYDEIVGPNGEIENEDLEIAVLTSAAGRDYAEIVAQLASGDLQAAQADMNDLGEISRRLRSQQGRLHVIQVRAQSQRAALAMVAQSQIERMGRRGVLLRGADFLKWADGLNAEGLLEGKPVIAMPTPGGSVLTDYGVPEVAGRSGADVLREMRLKTVNGQAPELAAQAR